MNLKTKNMTHEIRYRIDLERKRVHVTHSPHIWSEAHKEGFICFDDLKRVVENGTIKEIYDNNPERIAAYSIAYDELSERGLI